MTWKKKVLLPRADFIVSWRLLLAPAEMMLAVKMKESKGTRVRTVA